MFEKESHKVSVLEHSQKLGYAVNCMLSVPHYRKYPIAVLGIWTNQAISQEKIEVFFNEAGEVKGYIIWACVLYNTLEKVVKNPSYILHPTEWDEGDYIWVSDFCMTSRYRKKTLIEVVSKTFGEKNVENIYWASRYNPEKNSCMSLNLRSFKVQRKKLGGEILKP